MIRALLTTSLLASFALPLAATGCTKDERSKISAGAQQIGEGIADSAKTAWDSTKEGARYVGDKIAAGATAVGKEASDGWITTKIKAKIGVTRLFGVSVTTEKHRVTLSGKVKTAEEKAAIERLAKDTEGVADVTSHLVVENPPAN